MAPNPPKQEGAAICRSSPLAVMVQPLCSKEAKTGDTGKAGQRLRVSVPPVTAAAAKEVAASIRSAITR